MAKAAVTELNLEDSFLSHSTRAGGSGFLKNWKEDGSIIVWLHPKSPVYSIWNHTWFKYAEEKDEESGEPYTIIVPQRMLCLESEPTLKRQRFRTDDDEREVPPQICPFDFCIEWVYEQIRDEKLAWSDPVFKWETQSPIPDDREQVVLYAGGLTGLFGKRDKTREELAQMHKVDQKESESYLQNLMARMQYAMAVASSTDLDVGWVIALEAPTLGNKIKKAIRDEIKRCDGNVEKAHPIHRPYPFEWTYDNNKDFAEKYDVVAKSYTDPNDQVRDLLKQDPPDFSRLLQTPKLGTLRKSMEEAAVIDMPFDMFFEKAAEEYGMEEESDEEKEPRSERTPEVNTKKAQPETEEESEEVEEETDGEPITCDVCAKVISADDMVCPHCGAVYGQDSDGNVILETRPCGNPDCMEKKVPVGADGKADCPQCGTKHSPPESDDEREWSITIPEPPKEKKGGTAARRRGGSAAPKHPDARQSRRAKARAVSGKG